tara:strand:- start:2502 stop:3548 length:1047 start_codon:yes stop_codon:yes gene_type:complete
MKIKPSDESLRAARRLSEIANRTAEDDETDRDYRNRRLDADETAMLALQLEQLRARVYEAPYVQLQTLGAAPMSTDVDADAESFAWEEIDRVGEAAFIADDSLGDDLRSVEIKGAKQTRAIYTAGVAVHYTLADMRRAARAGKPLQARKLSAAREAFDRLVDRVAARGDATRGITYGLTNWAVGTGASQVRSTAMTSADWVTATASAQGMLDDLLAGLSAMATDSDGTFAPDTLALPMYLRLRLAHTMFTDGRPESVLERFLKVNGSVKRVIDVNRLKEADGTGANLSRGLFLATSAQNFEIVVPQPFTLRPPQEVGLGVRIMAIGRIAGFVIYQPLSMRYLTALPNA